MVYYFTCSRIPNILISLVDGAVVYMGRDKYENEELIKYAFPHDIW